MRPCELVQVDQPAREFLATARVALEVAKNIDANHPAYGNLLNALEAAFNLLDLTEPFEEGYYASLPSAHNCLCAGIQGAGSSLGADICAIGQSHIDLAGSGLWRKRGSRLDAHSTRSCA